MPPTLRRSGRNNYLDLVDVSHVKRRERGAPNTTILAKSVISGTNLADKTG
jgi:hypothetical protein